MVRASAQPEPKTGDSTHSATIVRASGDDAGLSVFRSGDSPKPTRVRIIKKRRISPTAVVSVGLALAAAAMIPIVWFFTRNVQPEAPPPRALTSVTLTWQCEVGHTFQAAGQIGSRKCWTCNRPSYPIARYLCPVHGEYEAQVLLEEDSGGITAVKELRFQGSTWTAADTFVCPRCGRKLEYAPKDPLEEARKNKRRSG